jgi:hypothetical protein
MTKFILAGVSAFALVLGASAPGWAHFDSLSGALINVHDHGTVQGNTATDNGSFRFNSVAGSFNAAAGIVHVQQNNGSSNSINAASAVHWVAVGGGGVAMGAVVFSTTKHNFTAHNGGTRLNQVSDSFNNFAGEATVQQNNGDNNEIGAATAIHVNSGGGGNVLQLALTVGNTHAQTGTGQNQALEDIGSDRDNVINPSFNDADGVFTVQQNNGNGNAISAATTVAANMGAGFVAQLASTIGTIFVQSTIDNGLARDNLIDNSFNDTNGVITVQQNNGDANVIGAATAVAVNLGPGLGHPLDNDVIQIAATLGLVALSRARDRDTTGPVTGLRSNVIKDSFLRSAGVVSVQQNNGSNNVMGIANAVQANINTLRTTDLDGIDFVLQFAVDVGGTVQNVSQEIGFGSTPPPFGVGPVHRSNLIRDSFNQFAGVATVQQNNGDNNVIGAATAVVANVNSGDKTDFALGLAGSLAFVKNNNASEPSGANRDNLINPSFRGAQGVITVQQNNGNNNVMGVANAVVWNENNISDTSAELAANAALGFAAVEGNSATDHANTDRVNTIHGGSFNGARGVMTVQQNNGDNNAITASTAVATDINGGGGVGFGPAVSLAALGASVSGNTTVVNATSVNPGYRNTISASFLQAAGVFTVQQNNGSNNAIQSAISVVANF